MLSAVQEEFQALLPLYLTADHFNKALPHMEPLLRLLAPERVSPASWLQLSLEWLNDACLTARTAVA